MEFNLSHKVFKLQYIIINMDIVKEEINSWIVFKILLKIYLSDGKRFDKKEKMFDEVKDFCSYQTFQKAIHFLEENGLIEMENYGNMKKIVKIERKELLKKITDSEFYDTVDEFRVKVKFIG